MSRANFALGVLAVIVSLAIVFIWIPLDVDSGIVEKVRRSIRLGDAFAPMIAAVIIGIGGVAILISEGIQHRRYVHDIAREEQPVDTFSEPMAHLRFVFELLLILVLSLFIMRYAGVVVVELFLAENDSYRLLRDSAPWKYIGFFAGGSLLVTVLISWVERRFQWRHLLIGMCASLVLIALYDLPFEDLLLPPNGDV